jgi:prepilin-type N-terminal cleavage/methylation domain-containing protein
VKLRDDAGFTLVEVLAGVVLGSIIMVALFGVFLTGWTSVRVSQDTLLGDEDVQLTLTYIQTDIHGASRDPNLLKVTNGGNTLTLSVPDPSGTGRRVTVTYVYATGTVGTLTRTVTGPTGPPASTVIARNLKPGLVSVFSASPCIVAPGAGCTSVGATLQFVLNGTTVTRTINAAPQLAYP